MIKALRIHASKIATASVVLALYFLASPRDISANDRDLLAAQLRFVATYLEPADNGQHMRAIRAVHPLTPANRRLDFFRWCRCRTFGHRRLRPACGHLSGRSPQQQRFRPACAGDRGSIPDVCSPHAFGRLRFEHDCSDGLSACRCQRRRAHLTLSSTTGGRTPVVFLRNDSLELSATAFTPVEIIPQREVWNTNAAIIADIDGDGHPDLLFGNYFRDGERVLDPQADTSFQMQHSMSRADNAGRNRLLLWQRATVTTIAYRDASDAFTPEMANGWTLALAARDLDDDLIKIGGENSRDIVTCRKSTSPTTSGRTGCCLIDRRLAIRTSRLSRVGGISQRPDPKCLVRIPSKEWASTSAILPATVIPPSPSATYHRPTHSSRVTFVCLYGRPAGLDARHGTLSR